MIETAKNYEIAMTLSSSAKNKAEVFGQGSSPKRACVFGSQITTKPIARYHNKRGSASTETHQRCSVKLSQFWRKLGLNKSLTSYNFGKITIPPSNLSPCPHPMELYDN